MAGVVVVDEVVHVVVSVVLVQDEMEEEEVFPVVVVGLEEDMTTQVTER